MIYKLSEVHYAYAYSNNLTIVGESNFGDSFLVQTDSCAVDYIESYNDEQLTELLDNEPFVKADEGEEEV